MADNSIGIDVRVDTRRAITGLNKLKSSVAGVAKGAAMAGAAAGALTIAVGVVGAKAFMLAAELEKVRQKTQLVFGDQLPLIKQWADTSATAMGLSSQQAQGLAANFGDLLIPMNFTREQAAAMATQVVGLSGALSEWSNGTRTAAEVSGILAKAMLGEREQLKTLGISIMETDVQGRLLAKGQKELTGTALQQAKAIATQELIFEKSQDAQAAYAAGSGSLMRVQNELRAELTTVKDEILIALIPSMQQLAAYVSETVIPKIREFIPILRENIPVAIAKAREAFEAAKPFLILFVTGLDMVRKAVVSMAQKFKDSSTEVKIAVGLIAAALLIVFAPGAAAVIGIVAFITLLGHLKESWREVANSIISIAEGVGQFLIDWNLMLTRLLVAPFNVLIDAINFFIRQMPEFMRSKLGLDELTNITVPDLTIKLPRLQTVASDVVKVITEFGDEMAVIPAATEAATANIHSMVDAVVAGTDVAKNAEEELRDARKAILAWERQALAEHAAKQRAQLSGNVALAKAGVTDGSHFDLEGNLVQGKSYRGIGEIMNSSIGYGGQAKSGRNWNNQNISGYELFQKGYITVNVQTGIYETDKAALGRAIAEAINTATDESGPVLKNRTVADQ